MRSRHFRTLAMVLIAGVLSLTPTAAHAAAHPFHVAFAEMELDREQRRFEIALKTWPEDLEIVVERALGRDADLESPEAKRALAAYLGRRLLVRAATSDRGGADAIDPQAPPASLLGIEAGVKDAWLYLTLHAPEYVLRGERFDIACSVLFDVRADQQNTLEIRDGDRKYSAHSTRKTVWNTLRIQRPAPDAAGDLRTLIDIARPIGDSPPIRVEAGRIDVVSTLGRAVSPRHLALAVGWHGGARSRILGLPIPAFAAGAINAAPERDPLDTLLAIGVAGPDAELAASIVRELRRSDPAVARPRSITVASSLGDPARTRGGITALAVASDANVVVIDTSAEPPTTDRLTLLLPVAALDRAVLLRSRQLDDDARNTLRPLVAGLDFDLLWLVPADDD
ncbi:MAG: DUF6702 family protein [Planctomycetota bacterium]